MELNITGILNIQSDEEFNKYCIKVFQYQYESNQIYRQFVNNLWRNNIRKIYDIQHYTQIPFLPIEFFKTHPISCFPITKNTLYFESSGTISQNLSRHYVLDENIYQSSILHGFQKFYGDPKEYLFIFLLPTEKERPHSSLIYMARYLQSLSQYSESGFYLNNLKLCKKILTENINSGKKILILGLSYALLDLAEIGINLIDDVIVMETGGMKGKKEEIPKKYFYNYLKNKLDISNIQSEYGMTELFSQAYSQSNGIFNTPSWMKILIREIDDPFSIHTQNKQGSINIIDLANIHTCSFIATSDIGKLYVNGSFEILGRADFSDIRGCNLMYQ